MATVCAHEFGHILQYQKGLIRPLQGWDSTNRRIELHADFLAGYFAGIRKGKRPSFPAVVFATTAAGTSPGYVFLAPFNIFAPNSSVGQFGPQAVLCGLSILTHKWQGFENRRIAGHRSTPKND